MNWTMIENSNSLYRDDTILKKRNLSILEFQLRVLDLVSLNSTPLYEKINFLFIVDQNLRDFMSSRLMTTDIHERASLTHRIEAIYKEIAKRLMSIAYKFKFKVTPSSNMIYIPIKTDPGIYSGESSYEVQVETSMQELIPASYVALYSGQCYLSKGDIRESQIEMYVQVPSIIWSISEIRDSLKIWGCKNIRYPELKQIVPEVMIKSDYYDRLQKEDVMIRVPYETYETIINFMYQMAIHPKITTIMMTLYRTAPNSKVVELLKIAKCHGKEVFVFVETNARGDEHHNLEVIRDLHKNGVLVTSGYMNYKVHAKVFCAISQDGIVFSHIGTGNYHEETAKLYTDTHLLTTNPEIGDAVTTMLHDVFTKNIISFQSNVLFASPLNFREKITELILKETKKGKDGKIHIKCNSICDCGIIHKLYDAADAGVVINIICRTGCSLYYHKNIHVKSKVGRFLEHDRFYMFGERCYISSADLLLRNINKRVEILCEILQSNLKTRLIQEFSILWNDPLIHVMDKTGHWHIRRE